MANPKKHGPNQPQKKASKLVSQSIFAGKKTTDDELLRISQQLSRDLQTQVHDHSAIVSLSSTDKGRLISIGSEKNDLSITDCKKFFSTYNFPLNDNEFHVTPNGKAIVYKINIDDERMKTLVDSVDNLQQKKLRAEP